MRRPVTAPADRNMARASSPRERLSHLERGVDDGGGRRAGDRGQRDAVRRVQRHDRQHRRDDARSEAGRRLRRGGCRSDEQPPWARVLRSSKMRGWVGVRVWSQVQDQGSGSGRSCGGVNRSGLRVMDCCWVGSSLRGAQRSGPGDAEVRGQKVRCGTGGC